MSSTSIEVAILMGSQSDWSVMKLAQNILNEFVINHEARIISAHRKADRLKEYVGEAEANGVKIFIAGAGMAAHLPGVLASLTTRPVLGVPLEAGPLKGKDALYSIVQMPGGIPVGTLGIGKAGAKNAALLAVEILAISDSSLSERMRAWRKTEADKLKEIPEDK